MERDVRGYGCIQCFPIGSRQELVAARVSQPNDTGSEVHVFFLRVDYHPYVYEIPSKFVLIKYVLECASDVG